jgi:predicted secreted Zn-dependent protease
MRSVVMALLLASSLAAGAQVFRWKDADGKVHYGDRPPEGVKAEETRIQRIPHEAPGSDVDVQPVEMDYFTVSGLTTTDIRHAMRQNAPKDAEGMPRWGRAFWHLRWKYTRDTSSGCRIGTLAIVVTSRLQMPQWPDRARASTEVQGKWDQFYRALLAHENGHRDNGIRAANDLARRFRGLGAQSDCARLDAEIENTGRRVISEYHLVDKAYDRSTEHGVSQGAVFR